MSMTMTQEADAHEAAPFWNRQARKYAASRIKDMEGYERTLTRTLELISGFEAVLELGCGTGTTALRIAPQVGRIIATDVSPAMIAIAREKAAAAQQANVEFHAAAADAIRAPDGPFDAVLAFNLLHLVEDRAALLSLALQRLKPGGLFISKTPCISEMNPLIRLAIPPMRLIGLAPAVATFKAIDLEREFGAAGFAVEECDRHGSGRKDPRIFIVAQKPGGGRG